MCSRIYIEDMDVVKMFIDEWMECLEGLEKEILKLEVHSEDAELLNNIFRRVHSIKGGSSFVGLSSITRLSHEVEFTLDAIRKRKVKVNAELIDSLLLSVDFLNGYIVQLFNKLKEGNFTEENGAIYLDFDSEQNEEPVLDSLKQAREKCEEKEVEDSNPGEASQEEIELDVLQTEEFRRGLAEGMKEQFLLECTEHIEQIENHLLIELDRNGDDREVINEVFRAVHSIKGGTGIYLAALSPQSPAYSGLKKFSEIVHTFESLLALIRDRGCKFEKSLVDLSYTVMDYSRLFINSVSSEEFNESLDSGVLDKITEHMALVQSLPGNVVQKPEEAVKQEAGRKDEAKPKSSVTQSIRVNQEKIDKMMNMISELLIAKNSFMHISTKLNVEYDLPEISKEVKRVGDYVNRISDELQNAIMSIRMVEIKTIFQKMPRIVRDIAQSTRKKIDLVMEGESTEIDKTIVEQVSDPLVHLVRNAADHGIESPEERLAKGKPETGRLVLRAYNKNKYVYIEIEDDGKGIDPEKIKRKAIEKGFISSAEAERLNRNQLINLIFLPGFSTAKQITEVSGRGVGMDIVKSNIAKIGGNIAVESEVDKGTKMVIQLPLTLAVSRGLIVEASGDSYIFPLEYISETVKIQKSHIHEFNGKYFTYLRGDVIGAEWLCRIFLTGERDDAKEELNAVIITSGAEKYAIIVDKLKSEQEFVVKTLEGQLASIPGISGSTLLGNGKVVLIVNPIDILQFLRN
ncbi:MAG: chemotaxis protein CheA [Clostridiales bacterium]|jgi:two-component system chemotaxis sensor kinase CheA|nr:chemotaxis protein CheA [Eubacteriales bacterium]MDH7565047.1 chemotaxis protein CheA [Clostridiales bacterium]